MQGRSGHWLISIEKSVMCVQSHILSDLFQWQIQQNLRRGILDKNVNQINEKVPLDLTVF